MDLTDPNEQARINAAAEHLPLPFLLLGHTVAEEGWTVIGRGAGGGRGIEYGGDVELREPVVVVVPINAEFVDAAESHVGKVWAEVRTRPGIEPRAALLAMSPDPPPFDFTCPVLGCGRSMPCPRHGWA